MQQKILSRKQTAKTVSRQLKIIQKAFNLSRSTLAKKLKIPLQDLAEYEAASKLPDIYTFFLIMKFFGVVMSDIFPPCSYQQNFSFMRLDLEDTIRLCLKYLPEHELQKIYDEIISFNRDFSSLLSV